MTDKRSRTVGVTGSRNPPTVAQKELATVSLRRLRSMGFDYLTHGDCEGFDEFCHQTASFDPDVDLATVVRPPKRVALRAWCQPTDAHVARGAEVCVPAEYLPRDRAIANASGVLLAAPGGPEVRNSGTWYTIRYARKLRIPLWIFMPDGSVFAEPGLHPVDPGIPKIYAAT